jgi:GntR family transcriptional regulator
MEFHKDRPIFLQIADGICDRILSRKWRAGDRIPSVRDRAVEIGVNPNTVMRAYAFLQENRVIENRRGIGYFVSEDGYANTMTVRKEEFLNRDLPRFFRTLRSLNLTLDDLKNRFEEYLRRQESLSGEES